MRSKRVRVDLPFDPSSLALIDDPYRKLAVFVNVNEPPSLLFLNIEILDLKKIYITYEEALLRSPCFDFNSNGFVFLCSDCIVNAGTYKIKSP